MSMHISDIPALLSQWNPTKNVNLNPCNIATGSSKKVWWKCEKGHEWMARVDSRASGASCPYCSGRYAIPGETDLQTLYPKIAGEWHPTKNGELTPREVTAGSGKKVWWQCDKGHEWQSAVVDRKKRGCPYCSGRKVLPGENDLGSRSPFLASEWHPTKNGELTPQDVLPGSGKKVWWKCEKGHEWEASILSRTQGSGCPVCANQTILVGENDLATTSPELAAEWHPAKNGKLTPRDVAKGSGKKIWWKCADCGHEWAACVNSRSAGHGCPMCAIERSSKASRRPVPGESLQESGAWFVSEWDVEKNGDISPKDVKPGSSQEIWWKCSTCGHEWKASVKTRTAGSGCIKCGFKSSAEKRAMPELQSSLQHLYPEIASTWNEERNGALSPWLVYPKSDKVVWWRCEKGHEWEAAVKTRTNGSGCPVCARETQTSFPEQAICFYTSQVTRSLNRFRIEGDEVDVYLPELGIGVEYDGFFYHSGNERKDAEKALRLEEHISLYRVKESPGSEVHLEGHTVVFDPKGHYRLLEAVISLLLGALGLNPPNGISIERDRHEIHQQYLSLEKENSIAAKRPDLIEEWNWPKNGSIIPEYMSIGSNKKVWWKCEKGHEWEATVSSRVSGTGCPYCSGNKIISGETDFEKLYPQLAAEWNFEKNDGVRPADVGRGSNKKVWWKCEKGHEWEAAVYNRALGGQGCPYCSGKRLVVGENDLQTKFPQLAKEWNHEKNGGASPQDVVASSNKDAWWRCSICGHEWRARISARSTGNSCPVCGLKKRAKTQSIPEAGKSLADLMLDLAAEWHPFRNGALSPLEVSAGSHKKVWWQCGRGHEWVATVKSRSEGSRCPYCAGRRPIKGETDLETLFPSVAEEWDHEANGGLDPSDVTRGSSKKVWWVCSLCGHRWRDSVSHRTEGRGCPECSSRNG